MSDPVRRLCRPLGTTLLGGYRSRRNEYSDPRHGADDGRLRSVGCSGRSPRADRRDVPARFADEAPPPRRSGKHQGSGRSIRRRHQSLATLVPQPGRYACRPRWRLARRYRRPPALHSTALARAPARLQTSLPRTRARLVGCASSPHGARSRGADHGCNLCRSPDRDGGKNGWHRTQRGRCPGSLPLPWPKRDPRHAGRRHRRLYGDRQRSPRPANPAVRSLFDRGLARADPLHIGIETERGGAIVNQDGAPSRRLFAVGPLTRAAFWEIIAIPDIRNQCAELAAELANVNEANSGRAHRRAILLALNPAGMNAGNAWLQKSRKCCALAIGRCKAL